MTHFKFLRPEWPAIHQALVKTEVSALFATLQHRAFRAEL